MSMAGEKTYNVRLRHRVLITNAMILDLQLYIAGVPATINELHLRTYVHRYPSNLGSIAYSIVGTVRIIGYKMYCM